VSGGLPEKKDTLFFKTESGKNIPIRKCLRGTERFSPPLAGVRRNCRGIPTFVRGLPGTGCVQVGTPDLFVGTTVIRPNIGAALAYWRSTPSSLETQSVLAPHGGVWRLSAFCSSALVAQSKPSMLAICRLREEIPVYGASGQLSWPRLCGPWPVLDSFGPALLAPPALWF